jgi:hypothetical protein
MEGEVSDRLKAIEEAALALKHIANGGVATWTFETETRVRYLEVSKLIWEMAHEAAAADVDPKAKARLATEALDGLHIETMMAISTAHVEEPTMKLLMDDAVVLVNLRPFGEEGAAIYLPPDEDTWNLTRDDAQEGFAPKGLFEAMEYARNHGCTWLLLDSAAPEIEGLPTFDW